MKIASALRQHDWSTLHYSGDGVSSGVPLAPSRLAYLIWRQRPDLNARFDLQTLDGRRQFWRWFCTYGAIEYNLVTTRRFPERSPAGAPITHWRIAGFFAAHGRLRLLLRFLAKILSGRLAFAKRRAFAVLVGGRKLDRSPPKGVNVVGYARAMLGQGESARMVARALSTQALNVKVVPIGRTLSSRQEDHSADQWLAADCRYRANILYVAASEIPTALFEVGISQFDRRYNIGYLPWELPQWPAEWEYAFELLDEIWSSSWFTYNAVAARAPIPVRRMPLPVVGRRPDGFERRYFELPEQRFLYLFAFDGLSFIARKNPHACVEAFKKAFPHGSEAAGLVIKAMNADTTSPEWQRLQAAIGNDRRIRVITETLDRDAMLGLIDCCDSFLSLHRSEGFGRGPAEAMALGKPVIVTGFSGNLDFTTPATACLVDYRLVDVQPGEYHFHAGQQWADPDIDHAAHQMRLVFEDADLRTRLGKAAAAYIATNHSPEAVGRQYHARLAELDLV